MKRKQLGVSMTGLLMSAVVVAALALLGMKLAPKYIEYFNIIKAVKKVADASPESVAEVKKQYENQATVDNITAVGPNDLDVTREGGKVVISFAYEERIPLFANISLLVDFQGSSQK